jgi:hypothetical protein
MLHQFTINAKHSSYSDYKTCEWKTPNITTLYISLIYIRHVCSTMSNYAYNLININLIITVCSTYNVLQEKGNLLTIQHPATKIANKGKNMSGLVWPHRPLPEA